nr:MAG TPA: hypothetical protein [Caudoviricetes sp.]
MVLALIMYLGHYLEEIDTCLLLVLDLRMKERMQ